MLYEVITFCIDNELSTPNTTIGFDTVLFVHFNTKFKSNSDITKTEINLNTPKIQTLIAVNSLFSVCL